MFLKYFWSKIIDGCRIYERVLATASEEYNNVTVPTVSEGKERTVHEKSSASNSNTAAESLFLY